MKPFLSSFFTLPIEETENQNNNNVLLTVFLWGCEVGGLILAFLFGITGHANLFVFSLLLVSECLMFILHFFLIWRKASWVKWLLPIVFFVLNTLGLFDLGYFHHVAQINFIFIIALVALTLGERAVVYFGLATILVECGLYLDAISHVPLAHPTPVTIIDLVLIVLSIGMTTWVLQVGVREIARGFQRAHERSVQLDQLNVELEQRVHDRTIQLENANLELQATKNRLEYLISSNPSVIYSGRATGDYGTNYISPNITHLLGYEPTVFVENSQWWQACIHPEDVRGFFANATALLQQGFFTHEYRFRHQDGTYLWLRDEHRVIRDSDGNPLEIVGSLTDITARKQSELALQASEQRYRVLFENSVDAVLITRPSGEILFANQAACTLFGYSEAELQTVGRGKLVDPTDPRFHALVAEREWHGRARGEIRFRRKDGSMFTGDVSSMVYYEPDGLAQTSMIIRDVTKGRAAEQALRRSEALLNATNQIARIGGWELDLRTQALYWTDTVKEIHELPTSYVPNLDEGINFYVPEHIPIIQNAVQGAMTGHPYNIELQIMTARGKRLWVRAMGRPVYEDGQIVKLIGTFQDIEAQKLSAEALRQSEMNLREAQLVAQLGNFTFDLKTQEVQWSEGLYHIFGLTPEEGITLERYQSLIAPQDYERVMEAVNQTVATQIPYILEHDILTPAGERKHLYVIGRLMLDEFGQPARIFGITQDITQSKKVELALQEREALYRALFEQANDGVILMDADTGQVVAMNQAIADLTGIKVEDLVGKLYSEWMDVENIPNVQNHWEITLKEGFHGPIEWHVKRNDESYYLEGTAKVIYDEQGTPRYIQTIMRDITERKQAEQQRQMALQEKEILLKEIHHRVKNNLQVISSLLYLQAQKVKDEHLQELFRESRNRVAAMALVHEQLYQTNNFAQVDFGSYAQTLIMTLFDSYGIDTTQIQYEVETDGTTLDIHTAIPCGLLVSEMISNSLKYAFPHRQGKATLLLRTVEDVHHLRVQDDGVGMPSPSHQRPGSLGLQLIERLTAQIGGTLEQQGPPGTIYHIQFPKKL